MNIKEVEQILNIPRATIRYYEKEQLICPKRNEHDYRDYSKEDVERLKIIIILRKLGVPVSDVSLALGDQMMLKDILVKNTNELQSQMEQLDGALQLSKEIIKSNVDLIAEPDYFFDKLNEQERKGVKFANLVKDNIDEQIDIFNNSFARGQNMFGHLFTNKKEPLNISKATINFILWCSLGGLVLLKSFGFMTGFVIYASNYIIFAFVMLIFNNLMKKYHNHKLLILRNVLSIILVVLWDALWVIKLL